MYLPFLEFSELFSLFKNVNPFFLLPYSIDSDHLSPFNPESV